MKDALCTYFDHNYIVRGVLTLRSIRRHDAGTPIYVLALSDLCGSVLRSLALSNVHVIDLVQLEAAYPELLSVKPYRKSVEYYFTLTPFLPKYILSKSDVDRVTYHDSDLYFFSPPQAILRTLDRASVAITPHRFSWAYRNHVAYGHFNVAWITFRRCPEGLQCLDGYAADCMAWCYDRVEGDKFGDQKYLDKWPSRYPSLKVIDDKGVNLAPWNLDNYRIWLKNKRVMVDDDPLVFYHFTATTVADDGSLQVFVPAPATVSKAVLFDNVIRPYQERYAATREGLFQRFPDLTGSDKRHLRLEGHQS